MVQTNNTVRENFQRLLLAALRDANVPIHGQGAYLVSITGLTAKAVSKWLNGEAMPKMERWPELAVDLGKAKDYFSDAMMQYEHHVQPLIITTGTAENQAQYIESPDNMVFMGADFHKEIREISAIWRKLPKSSRHTVMALVHSEYEKLNEDR